MLHDKAITIVNVYLLWMPCLCEKLNKENCKLNKS